MTKPFTVLIDLDSTVYNLWSPTMAWLNAKYGLNLKPEHIETWKNPIPVSPFEYWEREGIFQNLEPFPSARESLKKVHDYGIRQVFFSAIISKYGAWEKMHAVDRDFPFIGSKNLLMTGGLKDLAYGDILVDDAAHNLEDFRRAGGKTVLANLHGAPYCTYPEATAVLTNWRQYPSLILDIMNSKNGWAENAGG